MTHDKSIFTQTVHAAQDFKSPAGQPIVPPICPAVTYTYENMADLSAALHEGCGYSYIRYGNPTAASLEAALARLEGAEDAVAYSSGMAALHAVFLEQYLTAERPLLAARNLYGATTALLARMYPDEATNRVHFVDITDHQAVQEAIHRLRPRAVFLETISNPQLNIPDIPAIAAWAHAAEALVIVDSTFATPYLLQPLTLGADLVIHSATQYLGGHGDVMCGIVATRKELSQPLRLQLRYYGANPGPLDSWLVLRGMRTLALRMREQCANAEQVAHWLSGHPRISRVLYPGLPDHPQHALAQRLFRRGHFGAMVTFELRDADESMVFGFMEALHLIRPGTSLGDVYSLLLYPAQSSHHYIGREERLQQGITDGLVRLSVGIEAAEDIIADLQQALGNL